MYDDDFIRAPATACELIFPPKTVKKKEKSSTSTHLKDIIKKDCLVFRLLTDCI